LSEPLVAQTATIAPDRPAEAVDPELIALPAPPSGRRNATLVLMAFVVTCSLALVASLRHDLGYFALSFRGGSFGGGAAATELGEVTDLEPATLRPNSYVTIDGLPLSAGAVRYRRVLSGTEYVVFPLAGQRTVFVAIPASEAETPRSSWSGRLVTFRQLGGRMSAVETYFSESLGMPVSGESFVLLADETPRDYVWSAFLALLCAAFVVTNGYLIVRWFRRIDDAPPAGAAAA
jgi:hypothetical protein